MRYLIFGGEEFYPEGGGLDFRGAESTLEEAKASAESLIGTKQPDNGREITWVNILDLKTRETIVRREEFRGSQGWFVSWVNSKEQTYEWYQGDDDEGDEATGAITKDSMIDYLKQCQQKVLEDKWKP